MDLAAGYCQLQHPFLVTCLGDVTWNSGPAPAGWCCCQLAPLPSRPQAALPVSGCLPFILHMAAALLHGRPPTSPLHTLPHVVVARQPAGAARPRKHVFTALKPLLLKRSAHPRRRAVAQPLRRPRTPRCAASTGSSSRSDAPTAPPSCGPSSHTWTGVPCTPSSTSMPSCGVPTHSHAEGRGPCPWPSLTRTTPPGCLVAPQTALQHVLRMLRDRPVHMALMLAQQRALLLHAPVPRALRRGACLSGLLGTLPSEEACQLASARVFLAQF